MKMPGKWSFFGDGVRLPSYRSATVRARVCMLICRGFQNRQKWRFAGYLRHLNVVGAKAFVSGPH